MYTFLDLRSWFVLIDDLEIKINRREVCQLPQSAFHGSRRVFRTIRFLDGRTTEVDILHPDDDLLVENV